MADSRPDQQEIPAKPRNLRFNRVIPKSGTPSGESPNRQSTNAAERAIRTFLAPGMGMQPNPRHELRRALDRQVIQSMKAFSKIAESWIRLCFRNPVPVIISPRTK